MGHITLRECHTALWQSQDLDFCLTPGCKLLNLRPCHKRLGWMFGALAALELSDWPGTVNRRYYSGQTEFPFVRSAASPAIGSFALMCPARKRTKPVFDA